MPDASEHAEFRQANDPDTPSNQLAVLATSPRRVIRAAVAHNASTPDSVIARLLSDPDVEVQANLRRMGHLGARIRKAARVTGKTLTLRDALTSDAAFIVSIRTDPAKSAYLEPTPNDVAAQARWLERYALAEDQAYFVIESTTGESLGVVRLYDARGPSFCWGSWVIKRGAPAHVSIESALMVYRYAFALGFSRAHFQVRKGNESVWRFHERFGAVRVAEDELQYEYELSREAIEHSLSRYARYLPSEILIS